MIAPGCSLFGWEGEKQGLKLGLTAQDALKVPAPLGDAALPQPAVGRAREGTGTCWWVPPLPQGVQCGWGCADSAPSLFAGKTFQCPTLGCMETFPSMQDLMAHMKVHYKPNRYFK